MVKNLSPNCRHSILLKGERLPFSQKTILVWKSNNLLRVSVLSPITRNEFPVSKFTIRVVFYRSLFVGLITNSCIEPWHRVGSTIYVNGSVSSRASVTRSYHKIFGLYECQSFSLIFQNSCIKRSRTWRTKCERIITKETFISDTTQGRRKVESKKISETGWNILSMYSQW